MASRLDLQTFLEELLKSKNVYFQPPESVKMKYPAIVYALDDIENVHADNGVYSSHRHYSVTVIDSDPDSELVGIMTDTVFTMKIGVEIVVLMYLGFLISTVGYDKVIQMLKQIQSVKEETKNE